MSERFENGYFALVLVCSLGLISIAFVGITFGFSKGYQSADQEHSAYYAERHTSDVSYRECLNSATSLDGARQCIKNADATSREAERSEQDLNAQREMSQWAEGMLWAAWIVGMATLGATIVGVRYVYLTLLATQVMAKDTARIGEAQIRAYLSVIDPKVEINTDAFIRVMPECKNSGQSPALNLKISTNWEAKPAGVVPDLLPIPPGDGDPVGPNQSFLLHVDTSEPSVRGLALTKDAILKIIEREWSFWVFGYVSYQDVFGNDYTENYCFLMVVEPGSGETGRCYFRHYKKE